MHLHNVQAVENHWSKPAHETKYLAFYPLTAALCFVASDAIFVCLSFGAGFSLKQLPAINRIHGAARGNPYSLGMGFKNQSNKLKNTEAILFLELRPTECGVSEFVNMSSVHFGSFIVLSSFTQQKVKSLHFSQL